MAARAREVHQNLHGGSTASAMQGHARRLIMRDGAIVRRDHIV
jgi:hypothetical protein